MNGLGSLKTRHILRKIIYQLLSLSPHSTSLAYGTTIYDCGVFNITSNNKTLVWYDIEGNSFAHRACNIHSVIRWHSLPRYRDYYIIDIHRKTVAPNRAQTVCISKFSSPYSTNCVTLSWRTYERLNFQAWKTKNAPQQSLATGRY